MHPEPLDLGGRILLEAGSLDGTRVFVVGRFVVSAGATPEELQAALLAAGPLASPNPPLDSAR